MRNKKNYKLTLVPALCVGTQDRTLCVRLIPALWDAERPRCVPTRSWGLKSLFTLVFPVLFIFGISCCSKMSADSERQKSRLRR